MAFADFSTNNFQLTAFGNAQISTAQKKYGDGSAYFDGNGDYVNLNGGSAFAFGTGDFTIEFWAYVSNWSSRNIYESRGLGEEGNRATIYVNNNTFILYNAGNQITSNSKNSNQWYHVAVCRASGTTRMFIDGVQEGSNYTDSTNYGIGINRPLIGAYEEVRADGYFNGYIDDLRITKGVARYTANFTPPQQQLPTTADPYFFNVSLLLPMNLGPFTDSSTNNFQLSAAGNADLSTVVKKYGTASSYFDGNSVIQSPIDNSLSLGAGDFTIEFWAYPITPVGQYGHFVSWRGPAGIGDNVDHGSFSYDSNNKKVIWYTNAFIVQSSNNSIPFDTWTHVSLVRTGSDLKIYINGVNDGSANIGSQSYDYIVYGVTVGSLPNIQESYKGYIDDLRITKGIARYTATFTPPQQQLPVPSDPYQDNVSLLLHMDNNQFVDASLNDFTITPFGNARSSAQVVKYGDTAAYFDDSGDYLSLPGSNAFNFYNTDFTIEGWIYSAANQTGGAVISTRLGGVFSPWELQIGYPYTNRISLLIQSGGSSWYNNVFYGTTVLPTNEWVHLAWTCLSGNHTVYVNGSADSSLTNLNAPVVQSFAQPSNIYIGKGGDGDFNGYIDDLRITKGVARYTTTFTPPSAQLPTFTDPDFANVSLLLQTNRPFTDSSSNNFTLSAFGNAQISTSVKKLGSGSGYFDGTGDYLELPLNSAFDFGSGDFTIECWFYSIVSGFQTLVARWGSGGNAFFLGFDTNSNNVQLYVNNNPAVFGGSPQINQWNHVAAIRNGSDIKLFLNGVQVGSTYNISNNPINATTEKLRIGDDNNGGNPGTTGYIDELRITKGVARYTSNFVPHTAPFVNPPQIPSDYLAFWKLADLTDSSPNGNNLVNTNNVQFVAGKIGDCAQFPGNNSTYLQNNSLSSPFNPNGPSGEFTISCWVYPQSFSSYQAFVGTTSPNGAIIHTDSAGNLYCNETVSGDAQINGILQLNQWQHIVFVKSVASGNRTKIWYNGSKVYDQPTNNVNNYQSKTNVTLGNYGALSFPYNGRLDMVGLWNRELTQSEIDLLYNNGNGREP